MSKTATHEPVAPADPNLVRPHRKNFFQWVPSDADQLAHAEGLMLRHLTCDTTIQRYVAGLNTLSSTPLGFGHVAGKVADGAAALGEPSTAKQRHIIMIHGFGGGLAMWLPNFDYLALAAEKEKIPTTIHAIDMPGFARSERHPKLSFANETEAMNYMTGCLHRWFEAMGLTKPNRGQVDLVGHSFGAYVSATFTERHPNLVDRVVLCDPWGVPPEDPERIKNMPFKYRMLLKLFYVGNPFSLLRGSGGMGPYLLPKVRKDFADRWAPLIGDPNIFFDYVFHCNAAHPTGEQAFQACCTGPVYAKRPLQTFVHLIPSHVKVATMYGSHTWMDRSAGTAMMAARRELCGAKGQNTLTIVPHAGHQLNTDNVDDFNGLLARELGLLASKSYTAPTVIQVSSSE